MPLFIGDGTVSQPLIEEPFVPMNAKGSLLLDPLPLKKTIPTFLSELFTMGYSLHFSVNSLPWVIGEAVSRITLFGTESLRNKERM